ncbi:MAG: patatin-like phospholipase family protein [Desulfohalobiaceae bacterium]
MAKNIRRKLQRWTAFNYFPSSKIGLSLGAGGACGLAHLPMLEALEELGVQPTVVSGTSIGAIISVLYCAGYSSGELKEMVQELLGLDKSSLANRLLGRKVLGYWDLFRPGLGKGGLLHTEPILEFISERMQARDFADLKLPCKVVAADFWERSQAVFDTGPLLPAISASMAVPGLFVPVEHQGKLLVDGGVVNPVPFDVLPQECKIKVAVDVSAKKTPKEQGRPGYLEVLFNSIEIMQQSILCQKLGSSPPEVFIQTDIREVKMLQFYKAKEIFAQAELAKEELKQSLGDLLG